MQNWKWISEDIALMLHAMSIRNYGGADGIRDIGLLQSALARPQNFAAYGDADAYQLAASYAYGIIKNHPFIDGNKRTAFLCCTTFLRVHGIPFTKPQPEAAAVFIELAAGNVSEEWLVGWIED